MTDVVLARQSTALGRNWCANGDNTGIPASVKAGDAARELQALHHDWNIGVVSTEFGPNTVLAFGPIVWLKKDQLLKA